MKLELLKFGIGNAKLNTTIATFSLPAGECCPFAKNCKCEVKLNEDGKRYLKDGPYQTYRCFAASQQVVFTSLYKMVHYNKNLLYKLRNSTKRMEDLITKSLPTQNIIRLHVSGDFFNENYFKAWLNVAKNNPTKKIYAYTKSVRYVVKYLNQIPENMILTCSYGGVDDNLIKEYDLKHSIVYYHPDDAVRDGVSIDHDDSLAMNPNIKIVGLLLHGGQQKNSVASRAIKRMNKEKIEYRYKSK